MTQDIMTAEEFFLTFKEFSNIVRDENGVLYPCFDKTSKEYKPELFDEMLEILREEILKEINSEIIRKINATSIK